jgi:hypothetical protein
MIDNEEQVRGKDPKFIAQEKGFVIDTSSSSSSV